MKKYMLLLVVIAILLSGCIGQIETPTTTTTPEITTIQPTGEVKEFTMTARQWDFDPSTIEVNKGDTVRLRITSQDVAHGFAISEFGINEGLGPGQTITVEFVADKTGTFTFYCSVPCGAGHSGMRGQLIVK